MPQNNLYVRIEVIEKNINLIKEKINEIEKRLNSFSYKQE